MSNDETRDITIHMATRRTGKSTSVTMLMAALYAVASAEAGPSHDEDVVSEANRVCETAVKVYHEMMNYVKTPQPVITHDSRAGPSETEPETMEGVD
jgi:hypothetical protein